MPRGKTARSLALIDASVDILREIQPATVRAVCYRLFTLGLIESMAKTCTNRVSTQLVYAREHGLIPWTRIVDETREAERAPTSEDPDDYARTVQRAYRRDRWALQPRRVEVWSEKGTVRGTLEPQIAFACFAVTNFHSLPAASCRRKRTFLNSRGSPPLCAISRRTGNSPASCKFDSKSSCVSSSVRRGAARKVYDPTLTLAADAGIAPSPLIGFTLYSELLQELTRKSAPSVVTSEAAVLTFGNIARVITWETGIS